MYMCVTFDRKARIPDRVGASSEHVGRGQKARLSGHIIRNCTYSGRLWRGQTGLQAMGRAMAKTIIIGVV